MKASFFDTDEQRCASPQKAAGFEAGGIYNLNLPKFDSMLDVIISVSMLSFLSSLLLLSSYIFSMFILT